MSKDWKPYYGEAKSGPLHMKYTARTDGKFVPCQPPHDCKHTDEMREAFEAFVGHQFGAPTTKTPAGYYDYVESEWQTWQAATASAEAKYSPVIEKLVLALGNAHKYLEPNERETEALTLAAPLLKGEV